MAKKRDRFFALFGAILFLVTASAFSILVIWQLATNGDSKPADDTQQAQCQDTRTESVLSAPEVFKPAGDVTTLEKTDLKVGDGATVKSGDCVDVKYYGTLAKDGTLFDETYTKPTGFAFVLGAGQVIKGWDEGVVGMKVGGERRLVIPSDKAYGSQSPSSTIPADSDLVFVVKVLRVEKQ